MVEKTINRESLRWLLLEGTAIVLSILLAFWIDAWWSDRQSQEAERLILISLLEDFQAKKELVGWQRPYIVAILDSTNELLYASAEGDRELGGESIDRLLGDLWWNNNAAPWSATLLSSLIAGGDLALVSNVDLRSGLVGWSDRFARVEEAISREIDFYDTRFMSFLEDNASMPQILNAVEHAPGDPEFTYSFGEKFLLGVSVDHTKLLSSQQFQGLLTRRSVLLNDILTQAFLQLEDDLDATIAVIEQELVR